MHENMDIAQNIRDIKKHLPAATKLIAVSKIQSVAAITSAYESGQRDFGENYIQELQDKQQQLPKDINWHFIGHLQSNKVKYIAPYVHLIHGVDSLKLLKEINKQALKNDRIISCLLQVHIAEEETKFGFSEAELFDTLRQQELHELKNVKLVGLMGMASFTSDQEQVNSEFKKIKMLYDQIVNTDEFQSQPIAFSELSIGMSGDYQLAVKNGSTMVRIGSSIFGQRMKQ